MAGGLSGFFGVGGGILIVPGLVLLLGMDQRRAHGTSLAAIVPIAAAGVAGYALDGQVEWTAAVLLASGAAAGVALGTRALRRVSERALRRGFAAFMLLAAGALLLRVPTAGGRVSIGAGVAAALLGIGAGAGFLAGLLGVGGGIVIVPALALLLSVPDAAAKGTSLFVIIPTAAVGTVRNVRHSVTDLRMAAVAGLAGVASAFAASRLSAGLDPRASAISFAALLAAAAVALLARRA